MINIAEPLQNFAFIVKGGKGYGTGINADNKQKWEYGT